MAKAQLTDLDFNASSRPINVPSPVDPQDGANKAYVDSVAGGGGSLTSRTVEIDFVTGDFSQEFTVEDALALTTSKVIASPSAAAPTNGFVDDIGAEPFTVQGRVDAAGEVVLLVASCRHKLIGKRKINYILV